MADKIVDSVDWVNIGAIAALGFVIGSLIFVVIAMVIEKRRDPRRRGALVTEQQWLLETGKGTIPSKAL